jgi:NACalpha-BTF3-like transcription factor
MQHESWHNFLTSESGAVSVDWTVLTAAVAGMIDEAGAESMFDIANAMTNATILTGIEEGILAYNDGDLSDEDIALLVAMASVGVQRNIISADDVNLVSTY